MANTWPPEHGSKTWSPMQIKHLSRALQFYENTRFYSFIFWLLYFSAAVTKPMTNTQWPGLIDLWHLHIRPQLDAHRVCSLSFFLYYFFSFFFLITRIYFVAAAVAAHEMGMSASRANNKYAAAAPTRKPIRFSGQKFAYFWQKKKNKKNEYIYLNGACRLCSSAFCVNKQIIYLSSTIKWRATAS